MHLLLHLKRREEWRGFSFLSAEAEIFPRNVVPPLRFFFDAIYSYCPRKDGFLA
jgi:hypothetical protein